MKHMQGVWATLATEIRHMCYAINSYKVQNIAGILGVGFNALSAYC